MEFVGRAWAVPSSVVEHVLRMRAGGRGADADLRHVSVSEHPTTDIRETCTYVFSVVAVAGR